MRGGAGAAGGVSRPLALCSGGPALGRPEESAGHELRQAEPLAAILLREGHHAEGTGGYTSELRVTGALTLRVGRATFALLTRSAWLPVDPQVAGERYVYKFVCNLEALFSMAFPDHQRPSLKSDPDAALPPCEDDGFPAPAYEEEGPYLAEGGERLVRALPEGYPY